MGSKKGLSDDLDRFLDPVGELPEGLIEPGFGDMLPKGYLSVSQALRFLHCPHSWELQYIDKKSQKTNYRPFEGRMVHRAAEKVLNDKMSTGKMPGIAIATDAFSTAFEEAKDSIEDWEGLDSGVAKDRGIHLTKVHYTEAAPAATPIAVEERFVVKIDVPGGYKLPVVGVIDSIQIQLDRPTIEYDPVEMKASRLPKRVHDLKVVTDKWGPNDLPNDLQFHIYADVKGIPDVQVDQIVKGRAQVPRPRYEKESYIVTPKDAMHARAVMGGVAKSIALGHFPMTDPSNWWCSEKWCSMWSHCRGKIPSAKSNPNGGTAR